MDKKLEPLFTPWKIGNCEIKNRFVLTSMGGTDLFGWMEINHFDKDGAKFIMEVAKNNCGLVLPGCQPVYNPIMGQWLDKNNKMYSDLKKWMPEFHKTGAKLFVQLTAGFGRSFTVSSMMETLYAWYWAHPPVYMPENCNLADVEHIKQFTDKPVVCAGRLDPRAAADSIAAGRLDGAGFARQFLADQAWITKLAADKEEDIRPCILCHNGCFNMCHYKGVPNDQDLSDSMHLARCAVNAETMQWDKHKIVKTKSPKTVHIIGGGIGGMETARVLKLRGHHPVIHEKSDVWGGTFIPASAESYKGKLRDLLAWYRLQMKKLDIEVHLNDEVKDAAAFGSDPVVIATGSKPVVLKSVPGHEMMVEACDFLNGTKEVGETVTVIGGGLTGCEIAYELALQGKKPIIVEMKDDLVSQKGVCLANSSYLREWFALNKVPVYLETALKEVKDGAIVCSDKDGKKIEIPCDSVLGAVGYSPKPLAEESRGVYLVGDCLKVGNLRSVIWRAYEVAMKI